MDQSPNSRLPANPFSASRIRPDAFAYLFEPGTGVERLVERLEYQGWWGQIVGPHGSGKSTLLATLLTALEGAVGNVTVLELHDGQHRLPVPLAPDGPLNGVALLAVDGYEQLARWHRMRLKRFCRRHGVGLLVTSHADVGLPALWHTRVDRNLARRIVERLQAGYPALVGADDIDRQYDACGGDLREMLFRLYDVYEARTG